MRSPGQILVDVDRAKRVFSAGGAPTVALEKATCRVSVGDRIALVGQSGSGKSTLLHIMAGLDQPTFGTVKWPAFGAVGGLRSGKIGIAFQSQSLVGWLTAVENVALPLQLAGHGEDAHGNAHDALARFGLDHLSDKLPEELSGGQAQRISLVRATITNPPLFVADEPTGQLDRQTGKELVDMLFQWADENEVAVVVATHDLTIAERFRTIWTMQRGLLYPAVGEF
ncbi:ATP-binding cassette domain-containing protein [Rhizobium sp. BK376]|uniref:ABC transporter ATP-binding protein n=1 Tax=Rhizobium sp. BK376 TaxID=2512149 RepID=UPI00104DC4D5|nr:ATP-binding cassette domain-containing protein [Rhizobium sp. BK376]TCR85268.1 putative ABC transport system ATP-binding protein/lipoprotein-releasing system ATP-binding protein [Rhizobium sp. BK376]